MDYRNDIIAEEDELKSKEYLGTFRWKKDLKFPPLADDIKVTYLQSKWFEYLDSRVDFELAPYIIDALSYPLSILYALEQIYQHKQSIFNEKVINIVLIGASKKAEGRIAYDSNYFVELYNYFLQKKGKSEFKLNLYFTGEEMQGTLNFNKDNIDYKFFKGTTGDFLKEHMFDISKSNTFIIGMNCGFGAGYVSLTLNWFEDLKKLLKLGFMMIYTYTNDYEDMKGEYAIMDLLGAKYLAKVEDNPFKSVTVYQNEELWSCGNHGLYIINGYDKSTFDSICKKTNAKKEITEALQSAGINIK